MESLEGDKGKGGAVIRGIDRSDVKKVVDQIGSVMDCFKGIY